MQVLHIGFSSSKLKPYLLPEVEPKKLKRLKKTGLRWRMNGEFP
jgi:hypothetical protein